VCWTNVKDGLPEEGQLCDIRYTIPHGTKGDCDRYFESLPGYPRWPHEKNRRPEFEEFWDKEQRYTGRFYFRTKKMDEDARGIIHLGTTVAAYGWSGLRIDINTFVTHWRAVQ
jgi:hypothetical protein